MNDNYSADGMAEENIELPWLIFTLDNNVFAINSMYVNGIEMKPDTITPMPQAPEMYRGMVKRRGEVYPMLDMRRVFRFMSLDEEINAFNDMIEQRKQDHINWVNALERCIETGEEFTLATDPHNCAFGKWFYQFMEENRSQALTISKVEEPHRLLHETAPRVLSALKAGDTEKAREYIEKAKHSYVPTVLSVLDDAEKAFKNTFHETVVVVSDNGKLLGLLVDEVLAVGKINPVEGSASMRKLLQSKYFEGVARNEKINSEILVIDEEELLKLSDVTKF